MTRPQIRPPNEARPHLPKSHRRVPVDAKNYPDLIYHAVDEYSIRPLEPADFPAVGRGLEKLLPPGLSLDVRRMTIDLGFFVGEQKPGKCGFWVIEQNHELRALAFGVRLPIASEDFENIVWLVSAPSFDVALLRATKSVRKTLHWSPFDFSRAKGWLVASVGAPPVAPRSGSEPAGLTGSDTSSISRNRHAGPS